MLGCGFRFNVGGDEDVDGSVIVCATIGKQFAQLFLAFLITSVVIPISLLVLIDERLICAPVVSDCAFLCCRVIIMTLPNTMMSNVIFKKRIRFTTELGYAFEGPPLTGRFSVMLVLDVITISVISPRLSCSSISATTPT